jgi:hypothetical protein
MKGRIVLPLLVAGAMLLALFAGAFSSPATAAAPAERAVREPVVGKPVAAVAWNGDLRNLPQLEALPDQAVQVVPQGEVPIRLPNTPSGWIDPVVQTRQGIGQMPSPIMSFKGLQRSDAGGWIPPDTNGDVGPSHYIQTVNIGIGIYDKATGAQLVKISFDSLFDGTGTSCDNQNRGDVIALHDHLADRWILSDFSLPSGGPYLECIAVSQTGDPVSGGWYFYAINAGNAYGSWHDYPKLGVWPDAYYMTANMFTPNYGAKVWAIDRAAMLNGQPVTTVSFDLGQAYWSLLPANLEGPEPPAGSPEYFASVDFPNTLHLWQFHVDWDTPGNSTFTGPTDLTVADFGYIQDIPQPSPGELVDSLADRLMMQLQYRNFGSFESLWVNHTVPSGGVAGVRWHEVRDPGGTPALFQEGTYQPDGSYRWMGSLAVDGDGNMALGYSASSESLKPAIRYAGRLAGEVPGTLLQGETSLIEGTGVQTGGGNRWGDYSAMSVDPSDDCTFWYTTEYYEVNGSNWQTRIGSFKFPSCGQPKGTLEGTVHDANTMAGLAHAPVVAAGADMTLTAETDANGHYSMSLPGGTYAVTAGPLPPGYPEAVTIPGVEVTAGSTTSLDIPLAPQPYLAEGTLLVDDSVPGGNGNGYPEPGESGMLLWEGLANTGADAATGVTAQIVALTPGVTVAVAEADYPDIAAGQTMTNTTPFEFSIDASLACGTMLEFEKTVTTDQGTFTIPFSLYAKVPLPVTPLLYDDMENGSANWTTGGTNNRWAITTEQSHSPTHAWSDSPNGNYLDNTNSWLRSPVFDLSGKTDFTLSFWHKYALEDGWDYGYVEYSLDGGATWQPALASYSGSQADWVQQTFALPAFDSQPAAAFRLRLQSDSNVTEDGWYIDDVDLSYEPFACYDPVIPTGVPTLLTPADGSTVPSQTVTFTWQAGPGGKPAGYDLELDGAVITTTEPTYVTTLGPGQHTWRVRAFNSLGYSDYAAPWTVVVKTFVYLPLMMRNH